MNLSHHQHLIDAALRTPTRHGGLYTRQFVLFSANLYHCLPDVPDARHEMLFSRACAHQALAVAEQRCPVQGQLLTSAPMLPALARTPGIIATCHLGSYRLVGRWLAAHRIPFALVLASAVLGQQGAAYQRIIRETAGDGFRFQLLDAEHRLALLHMRRAIDAGHHLVVYLDGNTGTGGEKAWERHGCEVPFLHGRLRVRTGVAHLASMVQCPIYPVANWRDSDWRNHFCVAPPMSVPAGRAARGHAVEDTMRALYALLGGMARRYPEQWEAWFYLHGALVLPKQERERGISSHASPWVEFAHREHRYRMNRHTLQCTRL